MAILKLADLVRESDRVSFSKTLKLEPNVFEIFDVDNNSVFTHYNDLNFLIEFQNNLLSRGFTTPEDFYFSSLPNTVRLNLVNGNSMVEYNGYHDFYFFEKEQPAPLDGLIKYFRNALLSTYKIFSKTFEVANDNHIFTHSTYKIDSTQLNFGQEVTIEITH